MRNFSSALMALSLVSVTAFAQVPAGPTNGPGIPGVLQAGAAGAVQGMMNAGSAPSLIPQQSQAQVQQQQALLLQQQQAQQAQLAQRQAASVGGTAGVGETNGVSNNNLCSCLEAGNCGALPDASAKPAARSSEARH